VGGDAAGACLKAKNNDWPTTGLFMEMLKLAYEKSEREELDEYMRTSRWIFFKNLGELKRHRRMRISSAMKANLLNLCNDRGAVITTTRY
jgi:hypothetical protein